MESVTLSLPEAYDLALEVLSANGFSADHAAAIARNVTAGERDGCASHGLWRLLGIVDTLRKGKVSPDAEPQIHDQAPGIARADAGGAFSLLAYERALPLLLEKEGLARVVCRKLELSCGEPELTAWTQMVTRIKTASRHVTIALVGKYTELHDAYLSVEESLFHAGTANDVIVDIRWVDSSKLTPENAASVLDGCAGILVPGGFGDRGIEGMITAAQYARTHKLPYFGICLGMQIAVIEFARHVLGWEDAHSAEFDEFTKHPVIDIMPEQKTITQKGGTMRLGAYPCVLSEGSRAAALYAKTEISERHRHRYEFCNDFRDAFVAAGLVPTGLSPDGRLVEIVELPEHPWFVACQFHPEFKSRPDRPHPLFYGFVKASAEQ